MRTIATKQSKTNYLKTTTATTTTTKKKKQLKASHQILQITDSTPRLPSSVKDYQYYTHRTKSLILTIKEFKEN
jgi:uroporphyrinogen-III decarboxylase